MSEQFACDVDVVVDPNKDTGTEIRLVVLTVRRILERAVEVMRVQGEVRTGGIFALSGQNIYPLTLVESWGALPDVKRVRSSCLVLEKIERLEEYPRHFTSYQSRNPHAEITDWFGTTQSWGKWGGAVRAGDYIVSFSGFPELWDEAAMLVLAIRMEWLDETATLRRISRKRNPHFRPLLEAMNGSE